MREQTTYPILVQCQMMLRQHPQAQARRQSPIEKCLDHTLILKYLQLTSYLCKMINALLINMKYGLIIVIKMKLEN